MNILERIKKMIWGFVIIIGCIGIDQITKAIARATLKPKGSVSIIKNFFSFTYVENKGGAWGSFNGLLWLFIIVTILSLGVMFYLLKDFNLKTNPIFSIGLALLIAGSIGNFIDRIAFKYVTDFLDFIIFGYDFPVFNVADICIVIGVGMLIVHLLFFSKAEVGA